MAVLSSAVLYFFGVAPILRSCLYYRVNAFHTFRITRSTLSSRTNARFLFSSQPTSSLFPVAGPADIPELPTDDNYRSKDDDAYQQMGAWVPVGSISCLEGLDPIKLILMGRQFVVWKSAPSTWSVLTDTCPHRMAPLSLGRIDPVTNCLECSYHGWQFDRNGKLQSIPQLGTSNKSKNNENVDLLQADSRSVQAFPVHTTGDLLWVFLPTSFHGESFPRSLVPEDYYHGLTDFVLQEATFYSQDLPFSFDFLVENGLDGPAHAYFAHHGLGFDRSQAGPIPCSLPVSNFTELISEVSYRRKGTMRVRRYGFQRPFLVTNQQPTPSGGWQTAIIFFAIPIREGYSRIITTFDTLAPHPRTPEWLLHIFNQKILEGDLMVHNAEITIRNRQVVLPEYIHASSSDASCKAWRTWWTKYGLSAAPPNTFGPASANNVRQQQRHELVDPWDSHTKHCSKCRNVLQRAKLIQKAAWAIVWSSLALCRKKSRLAGTLGIVGALSSWIAGRLIRELQGASNKSEVGDRTYSASR